MENEIRRSSRANKGTHTGRAEHDVYYVAPGDEPAPKKAKFGPASDDAEGADHKENEGKVRCDGCGTTEANYNEETDDGGIMIECERCKTWQHARCMGFRNKNVIPEVYLCNRCKGESKEHRADTVDAKRVPAASTKAASINSKKTPPTPKNNQESRTRASVAKALVNVISRANSAVETPEQWAERLENALFSWAGATDKKYIDKSRSVMALVKKPAVLARLISHDLQPADFTVLPVEEIDPELKDYAEKVRQESIRRSVLTVNDDSSQRIRRTHKGEEVVESVGNEHGDDAGVALVARNVDHRKFKAETPPAATPSAPNTPNVAALYSLDDDDDYGERASVASAESDGASDDELDFILQPKSAPRSDQNTGQNSESSPERNAGQQKSRKPPSAPAVPPTMPTAFWAGEIAFPDVATFGVSAEFAGCTNYEPPRDVVTAGFHNRAMRVCKELMERPAYQIEGRLDRARADAYLAQVGRSRDLYLVRLRKEDPSYGRVFEHLATLSKVGVLSGRAAMVKDAYLFALRHDAPAYMDFATVGEGLYVLFTVKKNYVPVGRGILKTGAAAGERNRASERNLAGVENSGAGAETRGVSAEGNRASVTLQRGAGVGDGGAATAKAPSFAAANGASLSSLVSSGAASLSSLDSILSKLEGAPSRGHLPQRPALQQPSQPSQPYGESPPLSHDQMSYLSSIVQQNPHVQSDPQALLSLLQSMQT